jgi:ZIP family zinc transporter
VLLFVLAIAIHNLPEGIAAGVGCGAVSDGGDLANALLIAGGIALQNIPEGMVIIGPMLAAGISPKKTFVCAAATGLVEVVGTFLGYFAVNIASAILPLALAFAGGTMLYVISDEMIPETHAHGSERAATYSLLAGFCLMLATDFYLG